VTGGKLGEQTLLFQGAGEAATGIADLAVAAMVSEGLTEAAARKRCWLFDSRGLVVKSRGELAHHKLPYAHEHAQVATLLDAVKALKPTAIIGVAAVGGPSPRRWSGRMAAINARRSSSRSPIPTSKAECTAEQAYAWSNGARSSPAARPSIPLPSTTSAFVPRQGNNSYIFPGVGLGAIASGASRITEPMFMAAARTLAGIVKQEDLDQGSLYPPLSSIREVSAQIAAAVAGIAFREKLAGVPQPPDLLAWVKSRMYQPDYEKGSHDRPDAAGGLRKHTSSRRSSPRTSTSWRRSRSRCDSSAIKCSSTRATSATSSTSSPRG
jgi:malate dehydrogenase (oxaloacetate-decarboxylating)(NADP+)